MSWWISFKNIYGLIMGTSTDWMKPVKRPYWPTAWHDVTPELQIFLGGSGNCGVLRKADKVLLINCNSGEASKELQQMIQPHQQHTFIGTSIFSDYIGGLDQFNFENIYLPQPLTQDRFAQQTTVVTSALEMDWQGEKISIIPVDGGFSNRDLAVYLHGQKALFLGGLFYNRIHPIFDGKRGVDLSIWRQQLVKILQRFSAQVVVPHEGDICEAHDVQEFSNYLESLNDPKVEFSYCRENFDWMEIPGYTSLEDNFDFVRSKLK